MHAIESLAQGADSNEAKSIAQKAILDAGDANSDSAMAIGEIVKGRYVELAEIAERIARGDTTATGITTGHTGLDGILGGLQVGIVTLLAARPAMGKSALALNISNAASKSGAGVHVFSLEDTRSAYADRVMSMGSGVSSMHIRSCQLSREQISLISDAGERIGNREGWIVDDRSGVTAEEIVRSVRRSAEQNKTKLVIIDYIQLLGMARGESKREMLDRSINVLGDAAKEDGMSYLVLSQLNRGLESRDNKRPALSDLKECGTLEERAKAAIMLYRPQVYADRFSAGQYAGSNQAGRTGQEIPGSVMEILVRKNSNGQTGTVMAEWIPERMQIRG